MEESIAMADLFDLRAKIDIETNQVLDALSIATGQDKSEIVRNILRSEADRRIHEATVIVRLTRDKGRAAA